MSSILDALNKLEGEKEEANDRRASAAFDEEAAERELIGTTVLSGPITIRLKPMTLVLLAVGFSVVLAAISVGTFAILTANRAQPSENEPQFASALPNVQTAPIPAFEAPEPDPAPAVAIPEDIDSGDQPTAAEPVAPEETSTASSSPPVEDSTETVAEPAAERVSKPAVETATPEPPAANIENEPEPEPAPEPAPVEVEPVSDPVLDSEPVSNPITGAETETPAPKEEPARTMTARASEQPPNPAQPAPQQAVVAYEDLPRLDARTRASFGLQQENFRVNMVRPVSEFHPRALAIVNMEKVYIGQRIGETGAKLVHVQSDGVAIEIVATGDRFFEDF